MSNPARFTHTPWRAVLAALLLLSTPAFTEPMPIEVRATPIPVERFEPGGARRFGPLEFRGGLVLSSPSPDFGGISGLVMQPDGAGFLAVTDKGMWLTGRIEAEADRPTGISGARMAPMLAGKGRTLEREGRGDVESLARTPSGYVVGIERRQEVWSFPAANTLEAPGARLISDPELSRLGSNEGPEVVLAPPAGTGSAIIVIAEQSPDDPAVLPGFLFDPLAKPHRIGRFSITRIDGFSATDAAISDDGQVYLLERRYDPLRGVAMRMRRFPLADIRDGAVIEGQTLIEVNRAAAIDNMEAIGLHRNAAGELVITLMSDDNFSPVQRTVLLRFAVVE
ncbi:esterase-like activity of phytase family protein [Ancylobacter radicis]|uniref:Esterase-like activity of phytase family protein n=1 Tax=Ancylobacter radicis TaxID=2836179 RepID=A0ABS5R321_9HYPH|nr:esterase-like activity of phytase family protein [Ancylobacter radicis]MBS9476034.1 esterase-like activity of phytase family protein [Ancylobacter radicis]